MPTPDAETIKSLSALVDLPEQGTIFTAQVHKVGVQHGGVVYGDDIKQVLIWTGFSYTSLIKRSMRILDHQLNKGGYIENLARATLDVHGDATIEDVCHALQEVRGSFRRVLAGSCGIVSGPIEGHIWEPLVIDGVAVRGCSVYVGRARPDDPRAPIPGTVYIKGLKLGERLVTPAPNGHWAPDSKPKTIAKDIIGESLPVGLYCQYRLEPARVSGIAVAAEAVKVAKEHKIPIDPGALTAMFKVG